MFLFDTHQEDTNEEENHVNDQEPAQTDNVEPRLFNAFIDTHVFDSYELTCQVRFRFHLETVLNCLNIFGIPLDLVTHEPLPTNVAVQIHYRENQTHPLQLYLEEEGVITECLIKVLDNTDITDFDFQTENVVTKVVFRAGRFKEALSEIDLKADCKT